MDTVTPNKNIIIYSTEHCRYCHMLKDYLTEKGITFTSVDVGKDAEARKEAVAKSGQLGVPVVDIDGHIVIGYDKEVIDTLLGITV